uniref:Protein kinase domain-containing protein n=1 Tax=Macrostomum lignano TaxID=282301 RepID=A0A1I8FNR2_9PLAT
MRFGVLRRFQHANIVQLEIIFESESNCYLFMELCDAAPLADELNRRRQFQEADTRCLLRQVGAVRSASYTRVALCQQRSEAAKLPPKSPLLPEAAATEGQTSFAAITASQKTTFQPPARSTSS